MSQHRDFNQILTTHMLTAVIVLYLLSSHHYVTFLDAAVLLFAFPQSTTISPLSLRAQLHPLYLPQFVSSLLHPFPPNMPSVIPVDPADMLCVTLLKPDGGGGGGGVGGEVLCPLHCCPFHSSVPNASRMRHLFLLMYFCIYLLCSCPCAFDPGYC